MWIIPTSGPFALVGTQKTAPSWAHPRLVAWVRRGGYPSGAVTGREAIDGRELAARIGPVGLWSPHLQWQPAVKARKAVAEFERLGFGAVWVGEATGKEALTHASI